MKTFSSGSIGCQCKNSQKCNYLGCSPENFMICAHGTTFDRCRAIICLLINIFIYCIYIYIYIYVLFEKTPKVSVLEGVGNEWRYCILPRTSVVELFTS